MMASIADASTLSESNIFFNTSLFVFDRVTYVLELAVLIMVSLGVS